MSTLRDEYLAVDGANQILLDRCEKILKNIDRGYQGATHSVNRCNAEYADCWKAVEDLRAQHESLIAQFKETNAALGQLQEQLLAVEAKQTKMADWLKERFLKKDSEEKQ